MPTTRRKAPIVPPKADAGSRNTSPHLRIRRHFRLADPDVTACERRRRRRYWLDDVPKKKKARAWAGLNPCMENMEETG